MSKRPHSAHAPKETNHDKQSARGGTILFKKSRTKVIKRGFIRQGRFQFGVHRGPGRTGLVKTHRGMQEGSPWLDFQGISEATEKAAQP